MSSRRSTLGGICKPAFVLAAVVLGSASLQSTASAQVLPDGLDGGPCCTQANLVLPNFPKIKMDSLEICWLECDVDQLLKCRMTLAKPIPLGPAGTVQCGRFFANLRLLDPSTGALKWRGRAFLTYSRTWFESDGANQRLQVWRFLVNMKLKPTSAAGGPPCPVPACAATFNNIRVTGYVDYAQDLATGGFREAWMLHHSCDAVDHAPGFPRAGAFHPDRTFTFVGPSAGFAVGALQPVEIGANNQEDIRRNIIPSPGQPATLCEFEERVDAAIDPIQNLCACGPTTAPAQDVISVLNAGGGCGTQISTPGGPFLPGFLSTGIGLWTDPAVYPGVEILRWNCGGYDHVDPCVGNVRQEVFFGVTTMRGYDATQILSGGFGAPLKPTFIDQGNSIRKSDGVSTIMNVLYASDHIYNFNF